MLDQLGHFASPLSAVEISFVGRLFAAALFGILIGLDRSLSGKHAGMRTYAMVALGSCLFVLVGTMASYELAAFPAINPLQIASSIVIGIGFIGSGVAMFRGEHPVELTTASGIWVVAGVGMACGFGLYIIATSATILAIGIFSILSRVEHMIRVRWGVAST